MKKINQNATPEDQVKAMFSLLGLPDPLNCSLKEARESACLSFELQREVMFRFFQINLLQTAYELQEVCKKNSFKGVLICERKTDVLGSFFTFSSENDETLTSEFLCDLENAGMELNNLAHELAHMDKVEGVGEESLKLIYRVSFDPGNPETFINNIMNGIDKEWMIKRHEAILCKKMHDHGSKQNLSAKPRSRL